MLRTPTCIVHAIAFLQIPSGAKRTITRTGDHHNPDVVRVQCEGLKARKNIPRHLRVERIGRFGSVHGDLQQVRPRVFNL